MGKHDDDEELKKKKKKKDKKDRSDSESPKKKKKKDKKKDKKGKKDKDKKKDKKKDKSRNESGEVLTKKELKAKNQHTVERFRRGLDLKKRLVDSWDKVAQDATGRKPITSPAMLLELLQDVGFLGEMVRQIGERKVWKIADGRQISSVSLSDAIQQRLAQQLFEYVDVDGNKEVELNELFLVIDVLTNPDRMERGKFHFLMMDLDADGKLSEAEIKKMMHLTIIACHFSLELELVQLTPDLHKAGLNDTQIEAAREGFGAVFKDEALVEIGMRELLKFADTNKDGYLQEQEWLDWLQNAESLEEYRTSVAKHAAASFNHPAIAVSPQLLQIYQDTLDSFLAFF